MWNVGQPTSPLNENGVWALAKTELLYLNTGIAIFHVAIDVRYSSLIIIIIIMRFV